MARHTLGILMNEWTFFTVLKNHSKCLIFISCEVWSIRIFVPFLFWIAKVHSFDSWVIPKLTQLCKENTDNFLHFKARLALNVENATFWEWFSNTVILAFAIRIRLLLNEINSPSWPNIVESWEPKAHNFRYPWISFRRFGGYQIGFLWKTRYCRLSDSRRQHSRWCSRNRSENG